MPRALATAMLILWAIVALLAGGIWLGAHPRHLPDGVRDALVPKSDSQRFADALDVTHRVFYRAVPKQKLTDAAIAGMVESLDDRYSQYFTPRQYAQFQQEQAQQFSGIGVVITPVDEGLKVARVYDGSPAGKAGIEVGDVIVGAAGRSLKGMPQSRAVALIKGPEGTHVRLEVARGGKRREVDVERREITVPQVESRVRDYEGRRYLHLAVAGFTQRDVTAQVRREIAKGRRADVAGILLDLRHNPGGLIDQAQGVASQFLKKGQVIVSTRGRAVTPETLRASGDPAAPSTPLVVLVDRGSASASEIVAGALQDHRRAKLVGTRTYGKGVFQQVIDLPSGGALDLTAGQYFTPNGRNLGGTGSKPGSGLVPDVKVAGDGDTVAERRDELATGLRTLAAEAR